MDSLRDLSKTDEKVAEILRKFNVRVPKDLHRKLVRKAQEEGVSLNQMVIYLLSRSIGKTIPD